MIWIPALKSMAWVLSFLFTAYITYYVIFTIYSFKRVPKRLEFDPKNKFAILIAARNEETVIGNLVESLKEQDYPDELYDIYVIPNNCTDNTKGAAEAAGAKIMECRVPVKSKGEVLSDTLDQLMACGTEYDAICVFDADNLVHPKFLREMNNALRAGIRVAQGYRDSKNPYDTVVSGCYSIYYWMINRFYNRSRYSASLSAMVNGSGFMASMDVIQKNNGWHTVTMTEDIEFTTQCILKGERVAFVKDAIIYDEQPLTFAESWKQRKRWSTGLIQGAQAYSGQLLKTGIKTKNPCCFDQLVFFLAPYMQIIYVLSLALAMVLNFLYIKYSLFPQTELYFEMFMSLNMSIIVSVALSTLTLFLEHKQSPKLIGAVLYYWFFILSWIPINVICFFKKTTVWAEIKHTRNVKLSDMPIKKAA